METQAQRNPFPYSEDNKRYYTWNYYLKQRFGGKVFKVPLNAGFTCPNRDGTKGAGGCSFCSGQGSGDFAGDPAMEIGRQFDEIRLQLHQKWPQGRYIPYFQAFTNTYAPVEVLRQRYGQVLGRTGVVGLAVATRADALPEDVLDYLEEVAAQTYLIVELGLQTIHEETARRINRGHGWQEFLEGYRRLAERKICTCVHIMDGLPGESREMMLETACAVGLLRPHCVKIHLLHLLKGTRLAAEWAEKPFPLLSREEYVSIVCDQLEMLPPETVIQRLTGDGGAEQLIGPLWSRRKREVLNEIDKELLRRNSWQGRFWKG